ncbi:MAG: hypothetical protein AB8G05_03445 [Oligoflexales bacterium]
MFRIARLPLPIFSTLLALAIGIGGMLGNRYLEQSADHIDELELQYHRALIQSGAFLASHLYELKQHIDMSSLNNKSKDLVFRSYGNLFLRHGELDQLEVYGLPNCNQILKSTLDKSIQTSCFDEKHTSSGFFWDQTKEGNPVMGLRARLPENTSILLVAKLVLDNEWVALYPALTKAFREFKLNLNQNSGRKRYLITDAGYKPQSGYMASMWSEHWLLSLLPSRVAGIKNAFSQIQVTFLILSALLAFFTVTVLKRRLRIIGEREYDFFNWCRDLQQNTIHPAHNQEQRTKSLYADEKYRIWCEELLALKKEEQSKKSDFLSHFKEINHENQKLREKVKNFKEELSLVAENGSLAYHICQNAPLLIEKQVNQRKLLKEIRDYNQYESLIVMKDFHKLFSNWSQNLQEKGSRKFLRSLCEMSGEHGSKHKLEENIEEFLTLGNRLLVASENTDKIISQLYAEKELSLKTISYWSGLAFVEKDIKSIPMQVEEVCNYVSKLIMFEKESLHCKINTPESLKIFKFAWIPNSVLIASFYHIISMMTSFVEGKNVEVVFHRKIKGQISHVFVTLAPSASRTTDAIFAPSPVHWKKVKHLLLPYGIDLSYLPGRKDQATISLSWNQSSYNIEYDDLMPKPCDKIAFLQISE